MITGSAPRLEWVTNLDGARRSVNEACAIATKAGVTIPEYVSFHVAPPGYLEEGTYARTTQFREFDGTIIRWESFFHLRTRKIPFLSGATVFESDEAIVAVFGHELFELETLRKMFDSHAPIEHWEAETAPNNPDNVHSRAWDYADSLVQQLRDTSK